MNYFSIIIRFALAILIVAAVAGLLLLFFPKYRSLEYLHKQRGARATEIRELETEIAELETNQRQFRSNPDFVERVARESGMVKTNEFVYKLEE